MVFSKNTRSTIKHDLIQHTLVSRDKRANLKHDLNQHTLVSRDKRAGSPTGKLSTDGQMVDADLVSGSVANQRPSQRRSQRIRWNPRPK